MYEIKFKVGDKVKIPIQAIGTSEGIIIDVDKKYGYRIFLVEVSRYKIWFGTHDLELIKDVGKEKVIFT